MGCNNNQGESYIYLASYDELLKKVSINELINFSSSEHIVDILDIYPFDNSSITTQVFNDSENHYELRYLKFNEEKFNYNHNLLKGCESDSIFE